MPPYRTTTRYHFLWWNRSYCGCFFPSCNRKVNEVCTRCENVLSSLYQVESLIFTFPEIIFSISVTAFIMNSVLQIGIIPLGAYPARYSSDGFYILCLLQINHATVSASNSFSFVVKLLLFLFV